MCNLRQFLLGTTIVAGFAAINVAVVTPALAQTAPAPVPADEAATEAVEPEAEAADELVVVGSRIRRDVYNSPSPIQVITREEATLSGFASTTEALQSTAVTGGSSQINNAFGGFVTNGGPGANTISLRGLGAGRTLVLIDGRRVSPAGTRGSVGSADLNVLPNAMIERVEVLRDGASSIYGSDAVAGVVNVITRNKVDGLTLEGQFNQTANGGGDQTRFSAVYGKNIGGLNLSGSLEYYERENLTLADRDWTQCNRDLIKPNLPTAAASLREYIDPITGQPKCYPITGTGSNGVTINTIGTSTLAGVGAPGSVGATFNRFRPNAAVTTGLVGFEGVGGGSNNLNVRDTFDPRTLNRNLISPTQIYTAYLKGDYDVAALGDATAYFDVLWNRRESQQTGYRQLSLDYLKNSPLIPSNLQGSTFSSLPTDITSGQPVGVRAFVGFGNDASSQAVDFYKVSGGLRGDLGFLPSWRYDVTASFSKSDAEYAQESFITPFLANSLNVVAAPAGFNPALVRKDANGANVTCAVNITDPNAGCVPAPVLNSQTIGGQLPADWVRYVFRPVVGTTEYKETMLSANFDGPIFTLPAGEVQAAVGFEYRKAEIDDTPSAFSQASQLYSLTSSTPTRGEDSVTEVYGEVEVPLLKDAPFADTLTANASLRYTNYDSYGSDETYKVGLLYRPIDWVSLRATYGTSFRAPALFEQFLGATTGFQGSNFDPCNNFGAAGKSPILVANCTAELGAQPNFQQNSGITVVTNGGASQGLEPETSKNFTAGVVVRPPLPEAIGDIDFAVDYYDIEIENGVSRVGFNNLLTFCYNDQNFRGANADGYCNFVTRGADGRLTVFDSYTNVSKQTVKGIDYNVRWTRDVGPGEARVNLGVTQYLEQGSAALPTSPLTDFNGSIGSPEYTATLDAAYTVDRWTARYGVEYVAGMDSAYLRPTYAVNPTTANPGGVLWTQVYDVDTPPYAIHSASVRYRGDDWSVIVGARNLLDQDPPSISADGRTNRVGNAPLYSGYDFVGRQVFVNLTKSF